MSLCLVLKTAEGVVLSGDSRSTYTNNRIGTDYATKVFQINKNFGLTVVGVGAFLYDKKVHLVSGLIEKFLEKNNDIEDVFCVTEISKQLKDFFNPIVDKRIEDKINNIKNQKSDIKFKEMSPEHRGKFILAPSSPGADKYQITGKIVAELQIKIAGYNDKGHFQFNKLDFSLKDKYMPLKAETTFWFDWSGQSEYVERIILGYDANYLFSNPLVHKAFPNIGDKYNLQKQLGGMMANLKYDLMPLQDGIDLVKMLIETTSTIQRFADGTLSRSSVHGVGGAVDIAVITEKDGFHWIAKKTLSSKNYLESIYNIRA